MNTDFKITVTDKHIHFVGIGGIGMSGIAELLHNLGFKITGSDVQQNSLTTRLVKLGIDINIGHHVDNIVGIDVLVISTAIDADNVEVQAALTHHIPVIPRAQMLAKLMHLKKSIAVTGSHGKTTTTSLLSSIFAGAKLDPTYVIGGRLNSAGNNAHLGKGDFFIAEADESDASFLLLNPLMAIVTNVDEEHMATYNYDTEKLKQAFVDFVHRIPFYGLAVLCIDDPIIRDILPKVTCPILTYGISDDADVQLHDYNVCELQSHFQIRCPKRSISSFDVTLNLPGRHNALNATAAIAMALHCGVVTQIIQQTLAEFAGIDRRAQLCGIQTFGGKTVTLIDDYGHHPVEIRATIFALQKAYPNSRIVHIFQPHRFTRTRDLFDDFVTVLSENDILILLDVYSASEKPIANADSKALCRAIHQRGKLSPIHASEFAEIPKILAKVVKQGDIVLIQGAGSIGQLIPHYLINS